MIIYVLSRHKISDQKTYQIHSLEFNDCIISLIKKLLVSSLKFLAISYLNLSF